MVDGDAPEDGDAFVEALAGLIERANRRGVTIENAWDLRADGDRWDVQISRVVDGGSDD